jgi:type I restriction enzyme S subunit
MENNQIQQNIPDGWQEVKLGDIGKVSMCKRIFKDETLSSGSVPFYKISTFGKAADSFISKDLFEKYKNSYPYPKKGEILISASGTIGRTVVFDGEKAYFQDSNIVWVSNVENKVSNKFLRYVYQRTKWISTDGGIISRLYNEDLKSIQFKLPPLSEQPRIVAVLETWDKAIEKLVKKIEVKKNIKKGLMQDLLLGKKRLNSFDKKWQTFEIGELLEYEQPVKYLVKSTAYSNLFKTPVLTANKSFVLGYTDETGGIYSNSPVIIFDDFTTDNKYVNFPFKIKSSAIKMLKPKNGQVNLKFIFERMQLVNFIVGQHKRNYISEYQYLTFDMPEIDEQNSIAEILEVADEEILKLKNMLKLFIKQKKYLLNNLVTGKIRTPENLQIDNNKDRD